MRISSVVACVAMFGTLSIAGCAPPNRDDDALSVLRASDRERMLAAPAPPRVVARDPNGAAEAARIAAGVSAERLLERRGRRFLEISAIPYLRASPEGAAFLAQSNPRALVRGEPPASCPAAAASPPGAPDRASAVAAAISACFGALQRRGAAQSCGCKAIAVDDILLDRPAAFSFAPTVSAVLISNGGPAQRLVADQLAADATGEQIVLRDPRGDVALVSLAEDRASLAFLSDAGGGGPAIVYDGAREPFGYRRGRLTERIRLTNDAGQRLTLLIGVEARDVLSP